MSDAIIILAGGIEDDGSLPGHVRRRVLAGFRLWREGWAETVIVSGRWAIASEREFPRTEAEAMAEMLVGLGVPAGDVLLDSVSQDTLETALRCKADFLVPRGWKDVVVVTSDFHARRAEWFFRRVLGPEYLIVTVGTRTGFAPDRQAFLEGKESRLLAFAEGCLSGIADGDDGAVDELMELDRPVYHGE